MTQVFTLLFGPLVVPECRRALGRGWLILVRTLAGVAAVGVAISFVWWWWFNQTSFSRSYLPYTELRICLGILVGMATTIALVMTPAVLAGSLAGEKERGSMGLLLTTRVSSREIVSGRLAGKLTQVAMILLASLPPLLLIANLAGIRMPALAAMVVLPAVVGFGAGGMAVAASSVSRRGRDALLGIYLLDLLFLLMGPVLGVTLPTPVVGDWLEPLNPYACLTPLAWDENPGPALTTMAMWGALGLLGTAVASWRLRPSSLQPTSGEARGRKRRGGRRIWVPTVGDRPMLWKELHVERVGTLGGFGKWLGVLLVLFLFLTSTVLGALIAWARWGGPNAEDDAFYTGLLGTTIGNTAPFFGILIQWAIGLRAAVAISSERERATWDALLTSPLDGLEIVRGKLWGSLFALRWLFAAALWAWVLALIFGAMAPGEFVYQVAGVFLIGAFLSAVGVRTSLASSTATRAMSITIGVWLVAYATMAFVALVIVAALVLACVFGSLAAAQLGLLAWAAVPWSPVSFPVAWNVVFFGLYVLAAAMIVSESRVRFDRIAGRMAGGEVAVAVDRLFHGRPMEPVSIKEVVLASPPARAGSLGEFGEDFG